MQNLGAAPPLLSQSRRFQVSQLFYSSSTLPPITRSNSGEFVPFFRERDNMGRLLSLTNTARDSSSTPLAESKLFDQRPQLIEHSPNQSRVNKAVESFFKKIDMEARQLARSQFIPKKIVLKIDRAPPIVPTNDYEYDVMTALDRLKGKSKSCKIKQDLTTSPTKNTQREKLLSHKESFNKNESFSGSKQKLLRNSSLFQKRSNQMSKTQVLKKKQPQVITHKKSQSLIGSLKVKLNPEQPQYKRYKQQQQSSLKIFEDYEQGHEKFREKMKASKLIAYNIKKELQLD